jgi:hypothetical protein
VLCVRVLPSWGERTPSQAYALHLDDRRARAPIAVALRALERPPYGKQYRRWAIGMNLATLLAGSHLSSCHLFEILYPAVGVAEITFDRGTALLNDDARVIIQDYEATLICL